MLMQSCHLAGQTYVVYQRAVNSGDAFYDNACYRFYLVRFLNSLRQCHVRLHAYCLLANEITLLLTPDTPFAISSLLRSVNSQYRRYYQQRFERDIDVWAGSKKYSLIQGHALVVDCQKYIERLPLDRGIEQHPGAHAWSSYCANAFGIRYSHITRHSGLEAFLGIPDQPFRAYRDFIARPFSKAYLDYLSNRLQSGQPPAIHRQKLVRPVAAKTRHSL